MTRIDPERGLLVTSGEPFYIGYDEFVFAPEEADVILARGYGVFDGEPRRATLVSYCNGFPQIRFERSFHPQP